MIPSFPSVSRVFQSVSRQLSVFSRGSGGLTAQVSQLHSTASVGARGGPSRYVKSLRRIQKHYAKQLQKPKPEEVDPVLGRESVPFLERLKAKVAEPENLGFAVDVADAERLMFGAEQAALLRSGVDAFEAISREEMKKREATKRILSMQNLGLAQRKKLARAYAVKEFARFEGDTGSSEVQAAVGTVDIMFMVNHMKEHKGDKANLRKLQILVHSRQGILKYLRRSNPERYYWTIEKLGLSDEAVTSEFNLSRRYLEKYQFFGDNTLRVKDNKKERAHKVKLQRLEKKAQKFLN